MFVITTFVTLCHAAVQPIFKTVFAGFPSQEADDQAKRLVSEYEVGNFVLFGRNLSSVRQACSLCGALSALAYEKTGLAPFIAADQEGGAVTRISEGAALFPGTMALAASPSGDAYQVGKNCAQVLRAMGINTNFAPVLDVNLQPLNPIIGARAFSDDPQVVSRLGIDMMTGLKDGGMLSGIKHYPGHGNVKSDSHLGVPVNDTPARELEQSEWVPFQNAFWAGAEALIRWNHPEWGFQSPAEFIPLFEKNGFIVRLDEYIWEQACITLRRWIDHGLTPTPISVNMSRMHIHDPRLREKLLDLMRRYELPPHLLELELTESAFLENESGLFESMKALQAFGFQFSMDDFGSGYSSLNMLKSMPVDFIKIDRGFLNEVVTTERGKTVIRFSISLAREMSIKVIAEGVETEEQAAFLLQAGCAYAQGYFYSRPLPIPQFEALAFGTEHPFPVAPSIKALAEKLEKGST